MRNLNRIFRLKNFLNQYHHSSEGVYAVIACGGKSTRMGTNKSMLPYHGKPQCYHLYELLQPFCEKVFISCIENQVKEISSSYPVIKDLDAYKSIGPMAGLLSAFDQFPGKNIFLVGCDYPFITADDIKNFLAKLDPGKAAAFYNSTFGLYEPLLAYYNYGAAKDIYKMFLNKEFSLQHFLIKADAEKFFPGNEKTIKSIDTKEDYTEALNLIKQNQ